MDAFERYVRAGLEQSGIPLDDQELAIMRVVDGVYGPSLAALLAADLAGVWPESDLDPSRAPSAERRA